MNTLEKITAASVATFGAGIVISSATIKTAIAEKGNYIPAIVGGTLTAVGGVGMIVSNYLNGRNNSQDYDEEFNKLVEEYK